MSKILLNILKQIYEKTLNNDNNHALKNSSHNHALKNSLFKNSRIY